MKKVTGMAGYCLMALCCLALKAGAQDAATVTQMENLKANRSALVKQGQSTRMIDRQLAVNGVVMPATVVRTVTGKGIEFRFEEYLSGDQASSREAMVQKVNGAGMHGLIRFDANEKHECVLLLASDITEAQLRHVFSALGYNGYVEKP